MGLIGIITTVSVQESGGKLFVTVPSKAASELMISKADSLVVRVVGKDLKYRKVE